MTVGFQCKTAMIGQSVARWTNTMAINATVLNQCILCMGIGFIVRGRTVKITGNAQYAYTHKRLRGVLNYCSICGAKMDESTQSNNSNVLDAFGKEAGERTWNQFADDVKSIPSVDTVPVVHGHLIDMGSTRKVGREGGGMKTTRIENSIGIIIGEAIEMLLANKRRSKNIFTHDRQITLIKDGDYSHSIKIILGDGWFSEGREKVTG